MDVSINQTQADNIIALVECLKAISAGDVKISFYAEKMYSKNGDTIIY